jgi:hypothetical protein
VKRALFIPIIVATLGVLVVPQQADASYVCTTAYYPTPSSYGADGYISVFYTSLPDCGGSWEGARYYCTAGNTSNLCHPTIEYPLEGLLALYRALVSSIEAGTYVYNWNTSCNGGGTTCGGYVQFEAP